MNFTLDNSLYLVGVNELICDAIDRTDGGSGVSNPELGLWLSDPVRRSLVVLLVVSFADVGSIDGVIRVK